MMNFLFNLAGYSGNAASAAVSHNKQFERALFKALLKLLVLIVVLWLINISGWQALNLVPFFGVTILLIAIGFSPLALSATILAGAVTRADQIKGMPTGIPAGAQIWIAQVLPAIVVSCHILIGFLATWSFASNPIAFWYFAMACMTICSAVLAWKKMEGDFLFKLVVGYSAIVALLALLTTQFPSATQWFDSEGRQQMQIQQEAEQRAKQLARQKAAQLAYEQELALAKAKNPAPKPTLSTEHYLSSDLGKFPQITLDNTGIVVTDYEKSTLVYAVSGGLGKLAVQYRSAFTGPWTDATLVNGTEIRLQPGDNAWQYRFYTARGTLKFDLERAEVPS